MAVLTILECDMPECDARLELEGPYHIVKQEMKEEAWINRKIDDKWKIICNNHKESK